MSFLDGLYALSVFALPFYLLDLAKKEFKKIQEARKAKKQASEDVKEDEKIVETAKKTIKEDS